MPYADPNTVHNPATGTVAPAAWGDVVRDDLEFLIDPPSCSVKASSAQSVNNATTTILNAGTETFDNDAMHSTVTNNSRITIQTAGRYLVMATCRFAANATGIRFIGFSVNNGTEDVAMLTLAAGSSDTMLSSCRSYSFAAADYVEVRAHQTSGGALNVTLENFTAVFITR